MYFYYRKEEATQFGQTKTLDSICIYILQLQQRENGILAKG